MIIKRFDATGKLLSTVSRHASDGALEGWTYTYDFATAPAKRRHIALLDGNKNGLGPIPDGGRLEVSA